MEDNPENGQPHCERIEIGSPITEVERSGIEALQENEKRFRAIFDSVNDAIFIHDLETGAIVDVNQRMCEMFGFTRDESLRLRPTDSSSGEPPYTEQDALNWVRKAADGEPQLFEWHAKHKTGRLFWVEVNIRRASIGEKERLLVTVRDITERKKAEAALRESERRYTGLFGTLRDGFASVLMDKRIVDTNHVFRSMGGYTEEELNGMTYEKLTPEKWHDFEENIIREQVLKRGYSDVYEKEYVRKDGTVFPVEVRTHLLRGENGEPMRMWGFVRDITARKQGEEALRESEARAKATLQAIPDLMFRIDKKGVFLDYKADTEDLYVQSEPNLIGKRNRDLAPPEFADLIDRQIRNTLEAGTLQTFEYQLPIPGRGTRDYEARMVACGADELITIVRDITDRKQAEEALRRSEERYRSIFENSPLGIFQSTFEGRFLRVNPALARILGYESPRGVIDSVFDLATQVYADPHQRAGILQRMRENDGQINCENEFLRKDGRKWIGHLTMSIISDEKGIPHHLDGIVEDVTEKKTMEEKLQRTMEQLRTLSRRLLEIQETERRYIARELHDEIGQTLTALRINLKRTERSRTTDPVLAEIHESTAMVEALINQVRDLSIELRPSILDDFGLTAALDWYIGWLSVKAEFKVVFHTDFKEERFSPILELTCFRIAQEALTNAVRHSSAKNVYVDLEMLSTELHLTVRDDGEGFNIDRTHKKALEGKSFGLLGMQERATLAGGHLELTSRPGKGTVIHACFPLGLKA
jgi:PAS domain S-box-containing protein